MLTFLQAHPLIFGTFLIVIDLALWQVLGDARRNLRMCVSTLEILANTRPEARDPAAMGQLQALLKAEHRLIRVQLVGMARAKALALLGNRLSAEQAEQWGLIYRCVDDAELRDEALTLARHLATQPTYGLALIKRSLNASLNNSFDQQLELERDLQRLAGRSEDYREGISAFMEKRSPSFKGR